jgi:hypothetical protein
MRPSRAELNRLRKNALYEGHGFHGTPGQVSRAVNVLRGGGFSRSGTIFHSNSVRAQAWKDVPQGLKPS